jgi:hypothetical protein
LSPLTLYSFPTQKVHLLRIRNRLPEHALLAILLIAGIECTNLFCNFHHKSNIFGVPVVEKDMAVSGMAPRRCWPLCHASAVMDRWPKVTKLVTFTK